MPEQLEATAPRISRGRGGPSIGAPAGIGEQVLAVPAGVDGPPPQATAHAGAGASAVPSGDAVPGAAGEPDAGGLAGTGWERVLDELEGRLAAWREALRGAGDFPADFRWPGDLGDCPARLRNRARAILATQRDIEDELTARRAALGALLHGIGTTERRPPVPLFVDQRS